MQEHGVAAALGRREFLRLGVWGTMALGTVSTAALLTGCSSTTAATGYRLLREADITLMRALIPVVLAGALPTGPAAAQATTDTLHSLDQTLFYSSRAAHKQVRQLFDLLSFAPTRMAMAGVSEDWAKAKPAAVSTFLQEWRDSRIGMLRAGYIGLVQMIEMSWYLQPQSWPATGYVPARRVL